MSNGLNPGQFELVNRISILYACRDPDWKKHDPDEFSRVPQDVNDGVHIGDAPVIVFDVETREILKHRTTYVEIVDVDDTADYSATVDGNTVTYSASGGDTEPDIAQGLTDAINNDATVSGIVTADTYDLTDDGTEGTVRLQGDSVTDYTLDGSATNNGSVSLSGDPIEFDVKLFMLPRDPSNRREKSATWKFGNQLSFTGIDWEGFTERFKVGGYGRVAVRITDQGPSADKVPAEPGVYLGPGTLE